VLRSQSNPPKCLVVWSADRSRLGFSAPLVRSIDQSYGFGPGFPYKLGQLSSSNKNSGKLLVSPSVNFFYEIQDFRWSSWPLLIPEKTDVSCSYTSYQTDKT
jgi:hypothetical protein